MMKQHKWHKEIKAWADGAEIETRFLYAQVEQTWQVTNAPRFEDLQWEFRIKPQPVEPQYLYVSQGNDGKPNLSFINHQGSMGKIPLIVENDDD